MITSNNRLLLSPATCDLLLPRERFDPWPWILENIHTKKGIPFNPLEYPWVEGICAEWINPKRERIFFQAGSRLGKTETAMALMVASQYHSPDIGMLGGPTQDKVVQWIRDRLYPIFEKCHPTRSWVPPKHLRHQTTCRLSHSIIYGAWSGSATTLGDLDPRWIIAMEIDKFTKNSSEEADSFELLMERGAEIPDRKVFAESTPTITYKSRIDRFVQSGTNCRFHCPCPHCGNYQALVRGTGKPDEGGLIWDHDAYGNTNPNLAFETARYRCAGCRKEIHEEQRLQMIRRGKWVPAGCRLSKKGKMLGTPNNDGPDASFQLSRMYGATFSFGRFARAYVTSKDDREKFQSYLNNWEGVCYTPFAANEDWDSIAARLCVGPELKSVPEEGIFLTCGVDVQVDHWVFVICAWGSKQRGWLIDYGICHSWEDLKSVIQGTYPHPGGSRLMPKMTLIDARDGNKTDEVRSFAKSVTRDSSPWVWSCMGMKSGAMQGRSFRRMTLDDEGNLEGISHRRGMKGMYEIRVNTNYWQTWMDNILYHRKPGAALSMTFARNCSGDMDLFDQLMNEVFDPETGLWERTTLSIPNDFRDALRYSRVAAEVMTNGRWETIPDTRTSIDAKQQEIQKQKMERPASQDESPGWVKRKISPRSISLRRKRK